MISWVFHVQNQRDPYTRGHFSSVHWKGGKRHFCSQNVRVPSLEWNIKTGFLSQHLNFRRCPPKPLPSSFQLPLEKKKKIKTTCHHPHRGINSYLPKKGGKKRRDTEGEKIMLLLYRCGFHPERKTFVVSTCYGIRLLSCSLFLFFSLAFLSLQLGKATFKAQCVAVRSRTYLGPPLGTGSLKTREKCARENRGEPGASASPRVRARRERRGVLTLPLTHSVWAIMDSACSFAEDFTPKFASQYPICSYTTKDFSLPRQ